MRGAFFCGDRKVDFIDVDDPQPGAGEVVLAIRASGMCGSDLHYYRSQTGSGGPVATSASDQAVIAGHEPCGEIVAVGKGVSHADARLGMRAMVHHYWGCGGCDDCRTGWPQMCERTQPIIYGINRHGAHAPYMKVPARTIVALPDEISFSAGAAIACGTGTAYFALKRMGVTGRDAIAVFGQGPVGISATQLAAAQGTRVIAIDIKDERLRQAEKLGAWKILNSAETDAVAAIRELTGGGASMAMETSGVDAVRAQAARSVRRWGTVALVGAGGNLEVAIADILRKQTTLLASWTFSTVGLSECARFVADRGVEVDAVFTHRWRLEQADEAYRMFDQQKTGKGVFLF